MEKEQYGYSKGLIRYLQESEETIPKGSFVIVQRKGRGYWYFNKSSGENRLIYLCSVESKGDEESSFQNSIKILNRGQLIDFLVLWVVFDVGYLNLHTLK